MTNKDHYYQHPEHGLCLTLPGLVWLGFNENSLWKASSRNSRAWGFIPHPDDRRMILTPYENLRECYKEKVSEKLKTRMGCKHPESEPCNCGDVYQFTSIEPIRKLITRDIKAESFFMAYRYEGKDGPQTCLEVDRIQQLVNEASILNMIIAVTAEGVKGVKKQLGLDQVDDFYTFVGQIIDQEKAKGLIGKKFPTNYRNLTARVRDYKANGYPSLLHGNTGKANAAKVNDDISKAMLAELIEHPMQHDDWTICMAYNAWAEKFGYEKIEVATVGVHRRNTRALSEMYRAGNESLGNKVMREINGFRPTQPTFLWEHDDNHIDWLFLDPEDRGQSKYYHRIKSYFVIDSHCDLVLGVAYGETITKEMVRAAYVDAMYYIKSITGGWYLPLEVKGDKFGSDYMKETFNAMGHYYESPVGSKKRGYIEQFFGTAHWRRCLKLTSKGNYTGNNITAKNRGVNMEMTKANKADFPTVYEAPDMMATFIHRLRHLPLPNGKSKYQHWMESWEAMPTEKKKPISDLQFLNIFGIEHRPQGRQNSIGTGGIECQINGKQYRFSLPEDVRFQNIGKAVTIKYDPMDMSRILVTDGDRLLCLAHSTVLVPRAMADFKTGDRTYLNELLNIKRDTVEKVAARKNKNVESLDHIPIETIFQMGLLDKGMRQQAETGWLMEQVESQPARVINERRNILDHI